MKKKLISILLIVAAIGLSVFSWIFLPDNVAVQVRIDGQTSNTLPKVLAISVPLGLSIVGSVMNLTSKEEKNKKGYILSAVGIAILVLSLLGNI